MKIREILNEQAHRPWEIPKGNWKYYQEWNDAVFLHWPVDVEQLNKLVPQELKIDLYEGKAWVTVVAFRMEKTRLKNLPAFCLVSNFNELNIRTYVSFNGKQGVYFLSIEGGSNLSCKIAKRLSQLPYRYSLIKRGKDSFRCYNLKLKDKLEFSFVPGPAIVTKDARDIWLTERYALFQDTENAINEYEIHHLEWPLKEVEIDKLSANYSRFDPLISNDPLKVHYSPGVQVMAWGRKKHEIKKPASLPST